MRLEELKKELWGYAPEEVRRYTAQLEAEAKAERDRAVRQAEEELSQRVAVLEEALRAAQEENQALRAQQESVSDALIQAQRYAQEIRAEAEEYRQAAQERVQASVERQLQELEDYAAAADALKEKVHGLLRETLGKTEDIRRELNILHDKGPESKVVELNPAAETGKW